MKAIKKYFALPMAMALLLTGCSGQLGGKSDSAPALPPLEQTESSGEEPEAADVSVTAESPPHDTAIPSPNGDVVEISERLFIAQTNDIYINTEDYLGKTIKYEGLFKTMYWPEQDKTFYFVIRYGPGCCGYDGEAGFEVAWDGDWPEQDDWCEAVGVLEVYEVNGWQYLRLALSSLTVLQERGAEFVSS